MRSKEIEQLKKSLKLAKLQREVLVGILLGDAHLESKTKGQTFRLKIEQSVTHQAYVEHLYQVFEAWVLTSPRLKTRKSSGRTESQSLSFQTVSHSAFRFYYQQFYHFGEKQVPKRIHRWLTPRAVAYWFMDDGSIKSKQSNGVLLNTQGFKKSDVQRLSDVLNDKFLLLASLRKQPEGYQIYVSGKSYETLVDLIGKWILDEMRYKLPPKRRTNMPKE